MKVEETGPSDKLVVAVSSTVLVFLIISILTLIGGFNLHVVTTLGVKSTKIILCQINQLQLLFTRT